GVSGALYVGGLAGYNAGNITASYAPGRVSGSSFLGGLVGPNFNSTTTSYATGEGSGAEYVEGVVSFNSNGEIASSCWNTESPGQEIGGGDGSSGLDDAVFRQVAAFGGFDFDDTWMIIPGHSYPYLKHNPQRPQPGLLMPDAPTLTPPADGTYKIGDELQF